jgi:hypothetical protein
MKLALIDLNCLTFLIKIKVVYTLGKNVSVRSASLIVGTHGQHIPFACKPHSDCKGYVRIYKEEHEKCTKVKPFASPYLRPETNGPYVIYAYGWETLSIEGIYKHADVFTLVMGS